MNRGSVSQAGPSKERNTEFPPPLFDWGGPHPKLPRRGDQSQGIFKFGETEVKLASNEKGPGEWLRQNLPGGPGSGLNDAVTHVEGHAAGIMRKHGIMDANVYINYVDGPCKKFCQPVLHKLLPAGATLRVHFPKADGTVGIWEFTGGVKAIKQVQ